MANRFLVTGGAGFIGSAVVRQLIQHTECYVLVFDKLTYAANLDALAPVSGDPRFSFVQADIADRAAVRQALVDFAPDVVLNLAAESHVDRSIDSADEFIQTNVLGSFILLSETLNYWRSLPEPQRSAFKFHHVSTDEVFGSLGPDGYFTESTAYAPRSPYSASKAASDHFVRAWHETYGLPTIVTNCSNNYGFYQFPEKLVPLMILNAMERKRLPVYGKGENIRDWLFVDDHARALILIAQRGRVGDSYNIGGNSERTNLDVVMSICRILDEILPDTSEPPRETLIDFVQDRPGHDYRYAIDASKLTNELGWEPQETFASGLEKTIRWYLDNRSWWEGIRSASYRGERLGLSN